MAIELPPLPFETSYLEPYMSRKTLEFHYGKHHKNYVDTLNRLIAETPLDGWDLEEIMQATQSRKPKVFNNAAQAWNHTFFWNCLGRDLERPPEHLARELTREFGSFDRFKEKFTEDAKALFGSGWAWLVKDQAGHLKIRCFGNAGNPLLDGEVPLLTCDVWEHAYYLDYQNERAKFLENFWHIVNWDFVAVNFNREVALPYRRLTRISQESAHI